jgi:hypothetical protein
VELIFGGKRGIMYLNQKVIPVEKEAPTLQKCLKKKRKEGASIDDFFYCFLIKKNSLWLFKAY